MVPCPTDAAASSCVDRMAIGARNHGHATHRIRERELAEIPFACNHVFMQGRWQASWRGAAPTT